MQVRWVEVRFDHYITKPGFKFWSHMLLHVPHWNLQENQNKMSSICLSHPKYYVRNPMVMELCVTYEFSTPVSFGLQLWVLPASNSKPRASNYPWKVTVNTPLICLWQNRYHWETGGTTVSWAAGKDRLTAVWMLSLWKLEQHGKVS